MSELLVDSSNAKMAQIRGDLSAADAWDFMAQTSHNFAEHRVYRELASVDSHLQEIYNLDEYNDKCFPELPEAWVPSSSSRRT